MILRLRFYNVIRILLQNFKIFSNFGPEMITKLGLKCQKIIRIISIFEKGAKMSENVCKGKIKNVS